ncbi:MAG: hypothetical protein JWO63_884 [Frankiales bacterium]|nr:hypothetical protein [Frankiales bacterium]
MKRTARLLAAAAAVLAVGFGCVSASQAAPNAPTAPGVPGSHQVAPNGVTPLSPRPPARSETVFVPITPCRIVDTRVAGGRVTAARAFYVAGTTAFVTQGGKSGGCGIPFGTTAIAANIGATAELAAGYVKAYPSNLSAPNASVLNFSRNVTIANGVTLAIDASTTGKSLTLSASEPTQIFLDVTGYYAPQLEGMVSPTGGVYSGSSRLVSAVHNGTGTYTVTWDSDVSYCTPQVDPYPLDATPNWYATAYDFSGTTTTVNVWKLNATTHLPVLTDAYFYLTISC